MKVLAASLPLAVFFTLIGCGKKADVKTQVSELEKAFPAAVAAAPPPIETTPANQPISKEANAYVSVALSAVRTNDYAASVIALQAVQRMPQITAQQLMAVQRTMQAMTADLVARASAGDPKARADLATIEKTRSQ